MSAQRPAAVAPRCSTAAQLQRHPAAALSLGCARLDAALAGGVPAGLTEVVGEASTGKTQLLLQLLLQAQLPLQVGGLDGAAVYISTEGSIPTSRLQSMMQGLKHRHRWLQSIDMLDNVWLACANDLHAQYHVLHNALPELLRCRSRVSPPIRLIVIDSIASIFRASFDVLPPIARARRLGLLADHLRALGEEFGVPHIIVANQVSDVISNTDLPEFGTSPRHIDGTFTTVSNGRRVKPALGLSWTYAIQTRLFLTRQQQRRYLIVAHSPRVGISTTEFVVNTEGVCAAQADAADGRV